MVHLFGSYFTDISWRTVNKTLKKYHYALSSIQVDINVYNNIVFLAATLLFLQLLLLLLLLLLLFCVRNILNIIKRRNRYRVVDKAYWKNAYIPVMFISLYKCHNDLWFSAALLSSLTRASRKAEPKCRQKALKCIINEKIIIFCLRKFLYFWRNRKLNRKFCLLSS